MPRHCEAYSMAGMVSVCTSTAPLFVIYFLLDGVITYCCARHLLVFEEAYERRSFQAEILPYDLQPRASRRLP